MRSLRKRKFRQTGRCLKAVVLFTLMFTATMVLAAEPEEANGVLRSRAYKFRHISSQRAQEMLSQLKIGTGFDALSDEVLIVTSNVGTDLIKVTGVITVLDQEEAAQIRVLMVGTEQQPIPEMDPFTAELQTVSVGTMMDAPPKKSENLAIIDVLDNKLIAIASEKVLAEIEAAFQEWIQNLSQQPSEPVVQDESGTEPKPPIVEVVEETPEQVKQEKSLEEVMAELLEKEQQTEAAAVTQITPQEKTKGEDLMDLIGTEPNTTEEYIGDELLKSLIDEQKKTQDSPKAGEQLQPQAVPEKVKQEQESDTDVIPRPKVKPKAPKAPRPSAQEDPLKKVMEMLSKSAQKPETQQTKEPIVPVKEAQGSDSVSEVLRLQRENAILRQQMAAAQTQKTPPAEPIEPQEKTPEKPVDTPTPKIITTKSDETKESKTEYEKAIEEELGEEMLDTIIDVPQEVMLDWLVDLVGKQLGLNYMYDPAILKNQKVTLKINNGQIKVKDLYALLESVLRFRGFIMTRRGDLVTIRKSADITKVDATLVKPGDAVQPGDIIVSSVFQLNYIDIATAQTLLKGLNLGADFDSVASTNTLIVTDYAYRMERVRGILEMVDVPGQEKKFEYRQLKYMQAADLVAKLTKLVAQMDGVSMQVGAPAATTAKPKTRPVKTRDPRTGRTVTKQVPVDTKQVAGPVKKDTVYVDTDDRTNRLLMIGTEGQIKTLEQLIDTLDVPQFDLKYVKEYIIQYVEAVEVVNVLNELGLASVKVSAPTSATTARDPRSKAPAKAPTASSAASAKSGGGQPNMSIRPATNSLLVNATEEQHLAIELVIAHVDVIQKDQRTIREYEIQYVDTQEIIDTMTELGLISRESVSGTSSSRSSRTPSRSSNRTSRTAQPQSSAQAPAAAPTLLGMGSEGGQAGDITQQQPQIAVLEATNSLLVYATPRQHSAIALLIAHADRVPETTTTPYVVYALENQDPIELAGVLEKLIQETVEEVGKKSAPDAKIQTSGASAANVPTLEEQKIRVIPDEMSYSLIVYANKRNQQWISELISELDEYRPQVLLDCTLVEITKDDQFKFELDLISKTYSDLDLRPGTTGSLGGASTSISNLAGTTSFSVDRYAHAATGAGTFTGFFNSDLIQGLLTAMQKNEYGRVMARPKILVNDNQEGEIKTEDTVAVAEIQTSVIPGTATQTSTTSQQAVFKDYIADVTLTIKPHISKGDMLRLEITLNRTDFGTTARTIAIADGAGGTTDVPYPPDRTTTNIVTVSTIPDGTTIILGGLEKVKQSKTQNKVPILGDLPLVGGLFRDVDDADEQGKLYIFVKANIIRPSDQVEGLEDIRRVSDKYRIEFEEMEDKFQRMQDWPGVDPEPMDPLKVLEDDIIGPTED